MIQAVFAVNISISWTLTTIPLQDGIPILPHMLPIQRLRHAIWIRATSYINWQLRLCLLGPNSPTLFDIQTSLKEG